MGQFNKQTNERTTVCAHPLLQYFGLSQIIVITHNSIKKETKMEIKTVFKTMMMATVCLGSMIFASCDKDDASKSMMLSAAKAEIAVDSTQTITVYNGTTPLTATSSDEKVATATVDKSTIKVKGVKVGTATVLVTDANKQTASLSVTVKEMLKFDNASVTVATGKEGTINVKSGTAPYTVTVKDTNVATATVKDAVITVKGVKEGSTTLTVTDSKNVTGTVNITVSK